MVVMSAHRAMFYEAAGKFAGKYMCACILDEKSMMPLATDRQGPKLHHVPSLGLQASHHLAARRRRRAHDEGFVPISTPCPSQKHYSPPHIVSEVHGPHPGMLHCKDPPDDAAHNQQHVGDGVNPVSRAAEVPGNKE